MSCGFDDRPIDWDDRDDEPLTADEIAHDAIAEVQEREMEAGLYDDRPDPDVWNDEHGFVP